MGKLSEFPPSLSYAKSVCWYVCTCSVFLLFSSSSCTFKEPYLQQRCLAVRSLKREGGEGASPSHLLWQPEEGSIVCYFPLLMSRTLTAQGASHPPPPHARIFLKRRRKKKPLRLPAPSVAITEICWSRRGAAQP